MTAQNACVGPLLRWGVVVLWASTAGFALADKPPEAVRLPGGVELRLTGPAADLNDVAGVLEAYAKQLRSEKIQQVAGRETAIPPARTPTTADLAAATLPVAEPEPEHSGKTRHEKILFPSTLLWQPPYANQTEPRSFGKQTSLEELEGEGVADTAIGGTFPILRLTTKDCPHDGWQLDVFGVVFSRFVSNNFLMAADYRFGVPLTFSFGRWSGKFAYEHTSTHVGDEYAELTGRLNQRSVRDELVFGLAYRVLEPLRVYGILGWNMNDLYVDLEEPTGARFGFGAEWSRPLATGLHGQPFAALDVDLRGELDFTPNVTAQAGWQWLAEGARPGMRLLVEYYDGRSPFGQFLDRHENRVSAVLYFDF